MTNEIVVTIKGRTASDPWIVVHAEPELIEDALDQVTGDLIAKVHATHEIFQNGGALTQIAPVPAAASGVSTQQPSGGGAASSSPPPATAAPSGDLPPGCRLWQAPNPDPSRSQYTELWIEFPFVQGAAGQAFREALKAATKARFDKASKNWFTNTNNEAVVRQLFAQHAAIFGDKPPY